MSQDDDVQNDDDEEDDERDEKKKKMAKVQRSNFKLFYTKSPQSSPCPCQRIQWYKIYVLVYGRHSPCPNITIFFSNWVFHWKISSQRLGFQIFDHGESHSRCTFQIDWFLEMFIPLSMAAWAPFKKIWSPFNKQLTSK